MAGDDMAGNDMAGDDMAGEQLGLAEPNTIVVDLPRTSNSD